MKPVTPPELHEFLRSQSLAVQASVSSSLSPQAAVVGFVVNEEFELFFDTFDNTRKVTNLRKNPRIAFVIGGLIPHDERTVQYEGIADEPSGDELRRLQDVYFDRFPEGLERQTADGLVYIRCKPIWIRYSDYNRAPPEIVEYNQEDLL